MERNGCVVCGVWVEGPAGSACASCEAQPAVRRAPGWVPVVASLPPWVLVIGVWIGPTLPYWVGHRNQWSFPLIVVLNLAWSLWAATFAARTSSAPVGAIVGSVSAALSVVAMLVGVAPYIG